jgi:Protein of unknown function (DUF1353)
MFPWREFSRLSRPMLGRYAGGEEALTIKSSLFPLAATVSMVLSGCSTGATYKKAPSTGHFSGEPRMVAIAPDTFFFFQPDNDPPFTFTTHKKDDLALLNKGGRGDYRRANWTIRPEEMITNGASVPRNLWYVPGFAAFDFTRAALIHDWLFEAHHRYEIAKAGHQAALQRGDRQAAARNRADMQHYRDYADIRQEDAADIFAECIKVAMLESKEISDEFQRSPRKSELLATESGEDLKQAFRYNRPSSRTLWAYHYFVSPDCFVKTSERLWTSNHSDLDIYRVLTSAKVAHAAQTKGYLSPWLIAKFRQILNREELEYDDLRQAKKQGVTKEEPKPSLPQSLWDMFNNIFTLEALKHPAGTGEQSAAEQQREPPATEQEGNSER